MIGGASLMAWAIVAALIVVAFAIEAAVRAIVQPGHAAFGIRTQAARTGQALAFVTGFVLWNALSAGHNLPEWWFFATLIGGSALLGAIPLVATIIWTSRQVQK